MDEREWKRSGLKGTRQNRTSQVGGGQDDRELHGTERDRKGWDKIRQDRTAQDETGLDKIGRKGMKGREGGDSGRERMGWNRRDQEKNENTMERIEHRKTGQNKNKQEKAGQD